MGTTRPKDEYKEKLKEEEKKKITEKQIKVEKAKVEPKTIVRIVNTDLEGEKPTFHAITKIKGVGYTFARAVVKAAGLEPKRKLSLLKEEEIKKLEDFIKNPQKYGIPSYLFNRQKDRESGKDIHLTSSDLDIARKFDIQRYIDIKTYRGWRHMLGQPVRGQRTRSQFRERGRVVGVMRKAVRIQAQKTSAGEKQKGG